MTSAGSLLLSSLLGIALWPLVAHEALLGWLLLQGLLQTGHVYYSRRYMQMRAAGAVDYFRWMRGFQIGALIKGASWSLPFFFLSVEHDHPEAILLSFAVAGVTAYAGVAMAVVLPVALTFELAAVLPMSAWMFMQDDRIYYYMGTAALLYLGLLYLLLRQLHTSSVRSFVLGEENRRLADEQRESDLRMTRYFENAPGFFYTEYMNGGGKSSMPFASTGIRELFDVTAEEVKESTAPLFSQVCANDLESFVVARDTSCKNLSALHLEFRINHRLKGERWIELNSLPQREANGATVWHGFMQDITGRKRLEDALIARERDFRNLAENLPVAVIRYDSECKRRYLNRAAEKALHGSADELLDHVPGGQVVPATPAMIAHYRDRMEEVLVAGAAMELDFVLDELPADQQEHYEVRFVPEYVVDGKPDGVLAIWYDITERKRMENALQDREKMLEEAQRIAHVGSWDVDMVNDRLVWSDEIFRIWEIDKTQFRADFAAFLETVHPEDRERVNRVYNESVVNHTLYEVEHRLLFPDGRVKHIQERGEPQYDAQGKPVRFIGTSLDITERKLAEQYEQFRSHTLELLAANHALPAIFDEIVQGVEKLNSRMICSILLLDSEGKHLVDGVAPSLPDFYNEAINGLEIGVGVGSCGTCAATGERVIVEDIQTHPYWAPFKELTTRAGLGACWSQPILSSSGKVLGTFAIYHREAHAPTAQDISLIEKVAHIASIAIERKRMEAELATRERDFRSLAENLPDNIARWDGEGRYLYINPTHERTLGVALSEVVGTFIPDSHEHVKTAIAQVVASGRAIELVRQSALVDGELQTHEVTLVPEFDAAGHVVSVLGLGRNMTEFFRMQDAIAAREQEFRSLAESSPDAIVRYDREGRHRYLNTALVRKLGLNSVEEVIGLRPAEIWPDGRFDPIEQAAARAIETGDAQIIEILSPGESGVLVENLISVVPERDKHGNIVGTLAFGRDVTAIRATERKLAHFVDNLPGMAYTFRLAPDGAMAFTYVSRAVEAIYGLTEEEAKGDFRAVHVFVPAEDRERIETAIAESARNLSPKHVEFRICRPGQPERWLDARSLPETQPDGSILWYGIMLDITERKRIEEAMCANEQKLSTLFALSPLGIALTDMNGRYVEFNEAFRAICGYPADELMTLDYWTLTPKEYEAQEAVQLESLTQTGRYGPYEKEYRQQDGTLVPIQLNGVLVTGQDGKQYIWSIVEDITERKKTEAVLKERLERIIELNDYLEENARTLEEHAVELEASQEQLKDALEFSNGVINAIPDILFEMDREGRYHGIWTQQPELLAAQKSLLLNKTMHEVLLPETADAALAAIREAEENGFSYGNVIDIVLPSGETRWFELSISRKQGGSLSDTRFIVLSRDVTDRKKTEDVLRFVAEGEWMHGGESFLSALVCHLGKSLGVDYVVIDKAADKPGYVETVARYAKGELATNVRYGLQSTPCGEVMAGVPCCHGENIQEQFPESGLLKDMQAESYVGIPLRNIEGTAIGLIAVLHEQPLGDTHFVKSILQMVAPGVAAELERSRMEQVLRENYGALNEAQRISHVGNWELDLESGALVWSDEIYRIFEIDPERFGASYDAFLNAIHPDDRDAVGRAYEISLETRAPYDIEHRLLFADGRIKHVHERCETRYAEDGKPLRSLGTVQDITARKQAEESLRESYDKIRELNFHLEENAVHLEENARYLEEQATELEASQEQLKQTEAWYRSILHSAPDGMLVVDERGLIMQVNARIEAMFGYESGELAGNHVEVLLPQAARATHVDQRRGYFSSGSERRPAMVGRTLFGCRKDGSEFPVDVSLSRLPEIYGRGRAICAAVRDVSERHAMEVAREGALAEALRLAQLRSAFMAQMSHELRTPLNGILGHAQNLLHGGELGKKQIGGLSIIQHSGEHLLSIINGMLDHAAIEADKFELIPGNIQFETFLSTIIGMIRVRVEQKNLGFSCVVDADLPAVVRGDAQRLRQVLLNLLANAIKFTDRGQVILRVDYTASSRLRFAVQDSGVGIAADQLESIFLPFEQFGETRRRAGGTGLGLAISRKLVRLMGGDIKVESQPGIGSTFSFEIEMENESSDSAKVNAAALAEQAETRVAQATMTLPVPPRTELEILHGLALRGSMRDVMRHAEKLAEADGRYLPFVEQLRQLAKNFQTKALLSLIEQYRSEQEIES